MHKFLSILLVSTFIILSLGAFAQTATPTQPSAQPAAQPAPSVPNTDKAVAPEQGKASKKSKKKKLKKKKTRQAKSQ